MSITQTLNTEELRQLASFTRTLADDIATLQGNIQTKLSQTTFTGGAASQALTVMGELKAKVEAHRVNLVNYAGTLDTLANASDNNEATAKAGFNGSVG